MADKPQPIGVLAQHRERSENDPEYRASSMTPPGGNPPDKVTEPTAKERAGKKG